MFKSVSGEDLCGEGGVLRIYFISKGRDRGVSSVAAVCLVLKEARASRVAT